MNKMSEKLPNNKSSFENEVREHIKKTDAKFESVDGQLKELNGLVRTHIQVANAHIQKSDATFKSIDKQFMDIKKAINGIGRRVEDGVESIKVIFEATRHDFKAVAEGHEGLSDKFDDHEKRISSLERRL